MSFQSQLKDHLGDYKISNLGILEDGSWRNKRYRHILPKELYKLNILETIRDEFWDYFESQNALKMHRYFYHLNSSQAMCFNLFYPFIMDNNRYLNILLGTLGLPTNGVSEASFEKVIDKPEGTNFDFYIGYENGMQILFEVKLQESGFGSAINNEERNKKFKRIFNWSYDKSKFHHSLYRSAGIKSDDIQSFDDIRHIPTVEKSMMRDIQRKDPFPYGDALCVPLDEVSEYHQTSGTTGQPVYQADTWQDWEWWAECWSYILWAQGYRPSDRVFFPFGYNVFVAFWAAHYAAEKIGAEVVPGGVLDTQARILKIQETKATAMMATPTYVLGMAETAKSKMGIDPA